MRMATAQIHRSQTSRTAFGAPGLATSLGVVSAQHRCSAQRRCLIKDVCCLAHARRRSAPGEKRITTRSQPFRGNAKDPEKTHLLGVGMAAILAELLQFWDENDTFICPRWTGPAPRFHPFGQVEPGLPSYSAQKAHAAPNRQDAIVDLPTFLPFRRPSARSER
jgi:hypothetical protein